LKHGIKLKTLKHQKLANHDPANFEDFLHEFIQARNIRKSLETLIKNPNWISELIVSSAQDNQKRADYSSWLLAHFALGHPQKLHIHATPLFKTSRITPFDGTRRNLLKTLTFLPLNEEETSYMFDFCLAIITDPKQKVAAQVYALQYLEAICQAYPELKNETLIIVNEQVGKYSRAMEYTIKKFILSNKTT
jgi:hypothetical protein